MAQISDYTDYKTGTTSEEQSKLVETGKVVFSGKTTDNGDYQTKSVALSELKSAGVPDIGTDTNRGKFLGVKINADELVWATPTATIDTTGAQDGYVLTYNNNTVGWAAPGGGGGGNGLGGSVGGRICGRDGLGAG